MLDERWIVTDEMLNTRYSTLNVALIIVLENIYILSFL